MIVDVEEPLLEVGKIDSDVRLGGRGRLRGRMQREDKLLLKKSNRLFDC